MNTFFIFSINRDSCSAFAVTPYRLHWQLQQLYARNTLANSFETAVHFSATVSCSYDLHVRVMWFLNILTQRPAYIVILRNNLHFAGEQ